MTTELKLVEYDGFKYYEDKAPLTLSGSCNGCAHQLKESCFAVDENNKNIFPCSPGSNGSFVIWKLYNPEES